MDPFSILRACGVFQPLNFIPTLPLMPTPATPASTISVTVIRPTGMETAPMKLWAGQSADGRAGYLFYRFGK